MDTDQDCLRFFVPRWMDETDTNPQNSNARALLSRFSDPRARWIAIHGEKPPENIRTNLAIETHRISHTRFWHFELAWAYQTKCDAIFYPGPSWADKAGFNARRVIGRYVPIIATFEGIIATEQEVRDISNLMGHPVFGQQGADATASRIRWMYQTSTHIVAISPFLAQVGKSLYGDKISCLALGVDNCIFHDQGRREPARCRVVGCGGVKSSKGPELFLSLAARYTQADFLWFGDGEMRQPLMVEARKKRLENLAFPGPVLPEALAEQFRNCSLFVLPSRSEGVPKVTQEAAACGLPIVLYGFYEAPTVVHKANGLVAWSESEFIEYVGALIEDRKTRLTMGHRSAEMAKEWSWDQVAHRWEELLIRIASNSCR